MKHLTAETFGEIRRFHIYDHDADEWIMSGADFGDMGIAIDHKHNQDIETFDNPEVIAKGQSNLQFIWEDADEQADRHLLDEEVATEIFEAAQRDIARNTNTTAETIRIVEIVAPGEVRYRVL